MAFFLHPSAVTGLFPSFTISAQLHVGFGWVYFLYTIKKLWVLHVLLLYHISRPILVLLLVLKLPSTIVCEVAPQMYEHINTTTSIQHAQAHFAIQFCFIHFFRLSRDFYFMKCFDSTIFKLSWSKCIKCNVALFSIIVFFFLFIVDVMLRLHHLAHSLQLDQKCINFIFMMAGWQRAVNKKRMSDVFILVWRGPPCIDTGECCLISTKPWASSKIYGEKMCFIKWISFRSIGSTLLTWSFALCCNWTAEIDLNVNGISFRTN